MLGIEAIERWLGLLSAARAAFRWPTADAGSRALGAVPDHHADPRLEGRLPKRARIRDADIDLFHQPRRARAVQEASAPVALRLRAVKAPAKCTMSSLNARVRDLNGIRASPT